MIIVTARLTAKYSLKNPDIQLKKKKKKILIICTVVHRMGVRRCIM